MRRRLLEAGAAGLAGGVAMIPFGLVLRRTFGYPLDVYGELLLRGLLGAVTPAALLAQHLLISLALAPPLVVLLVWRRRASPLQLGLLYGVAIWLVLNSWLLPEAFGRPTPWHLGWTAIWPSLTVHLVYGATAAVAARRMGGAAPPRA